MKHIPRLDISFSLLILFFCVLSSYSSLQLDEYEKFSTSPHTSDSEFLDALDKWRLLHRNDQALKKRTPYANEDEITKNKKIINSERENQIRSSDKKCNIAILIRAFRPTPSSMVRLSRWARELKVHNARNDSEINYSFFMSIDISHDLRTANSVKRLLAPHGVKIHTYSNADILSTYPLLMNLRTRLPPFYFEHGLTLSKGFHVEAIGLWWRWAKKAENEKV